MNLLTLSNLHPRPDQPTRGLYNAALFAELGKKVAGVGGRLTNLCLVPNWRVSRWRQITRWQSSQDGVTTRYVPVPYLPVVGRSWAPWLYGFGLKSAEKDLCEADLVYASWLFPDGVAAAHMARRLKKTLWLMALGSDTFHLNVPARSKQILAACDYAQGIVCVWKGLAERLEKAGVPREKLHIVPNGVDGEKFKFRPRSSEICQSLGLDAEALTRPVVLFVGNLVHVKGPDLYIEAALKILENGKLKSAPLFLVVGDGALRAQLEQRVRVAGRLADIRFLGRLSQPVIARLMNDSDCLCLASRSEGMPNVVLEALASGLPVAGTAVGAVSDLIVNARNGFTAPPEEPLALANAVVRVLGVNADRLEISKHTRETYSWDRQASTILHVMKADS